MNEMFELHQEEIKKINYVYYKSNYDINLIKKEIKILINDLLDDFFIPNVYLFYVKDKYEYHIIVPTQYGNTIMVIRILRITDYIDANTTNHIHPLFYASKIESNYGIQLIRHKGISHYKKLRELMMEKLEENNWIR
jgi:hypothetical protein